MTLPAGRRIGEAWDNEKRASGVGGGALARRHALP